MDFRVHPFDPVLQNDAYYANEFGEAIYNGGQGYYKYMWYGFLREDGGYDLAALGDRGQLIYLSPLKNLVIVRHGETYGLPGSALNWSDLLFAFASEF